MILIVLLIERNDILYKKDGNSINTPNIDLLVIMRDFEIYDKELFNKTKQAINKTKQAINKTKQAIDRTDEMLIDCMKLNKYLSKYNIYTFIPLKVKKGIAIQEDNYKIIRNYIEESNILYNEYMLSLNDVQIQINRYEEHMDRYIGEI